jgi:hypothetical protein
VEERRAPHPPPHMRARLACLGTRHRPHIDPMAGSPLRRARKQGVRLDDGTVIPFPRMARMADLPPGWRHFSTADKIKHLLGISFDHAPEILSWPRAELDPLRLSLQVQVMRVIVMIAGKALFIVGRKRYGKNRAAGGGVAKI